MNRKHGKIVKWKDIFVEDYGRYTNPKIQICDAEDGTKFLHVFIPIAKHEKGRGYAHYLPSWKGLRAMIDGLIEIYNKAEVEKELGIKIK